MERTYGAKYESVTGGTAEIAKAFRADVKAAIKSGELPAALKLSVRTRRYAGGSSIDVDIKVTGFEVLNTARVAIERAEPHEYHNTFHYPVFTEEASAVREKIQSMLDAYNHDGSDSMSDYFDVRFYGHVGYCDDLTSAERARKVAHIELLTSAEAAAAKLAV